MGRKKSATTLEDTETLFTPDKLKARDAALASHQAEEDILKSQDLAVQNQIADMDPEEQAAVRSMQAEVQANIDEMNDDFFSDEAFAASKRNNEAARAGSTQPVGKIFEFKGNLLIKTPFGETIPAQTYVTVLQDQVIGVTNAVMALEKENKELYAKLDNYGDSFATGQLSFFALIRVAFSRLFRRTTNG